MTLRKILFLDALTCLSCGALMSLASGPLAALLSLPASLLRYAGLSLFPIDAAQLVHGSCTSEGTVPQQ